MGSTELRARHGDARADHWHAEVDRLTREGVGRFRGVVVKGLGDGLMAIFRIPTEAVRAAVAIQHSLERRNRGANLELRVRIGIAMGEVDVTEEDVFGYAVNEASRLCAAAGAGGILVGEMAAAAARRAEVQFASSVLVGVTPSAPPAVALPVVIAPTAPPLAPLPSPLDNAARAGPFVGRRDELDVLLDCWRHALEGEAQVAVLTGEAGLGKTTLLGQFSLEVADGPATVLYGRCDERTSAPYQPVADALAHLVEHSPQSELEALLGTSAPELVRLVPRLTERIRIDVVPRPLDLESERWRLQDAVVTIVRVLSSLAPVLLIVDDLHWAGSTTIDVLDRLLRAISRDRIMVVLALRPWDPATDPHVGELLADRHRLDCAVTDVTLRGLERPEVGEFAAQWKQHSQLDPVQTDELWAITAGNPLFISQVLRAAREDEVLPRRLPQGLLDVIDRQLDRHTPATLEILRVAALIGTRFELQVVATAAGADRATALEGLDEATEAGVVLALGGTPLRYEFTHALVRRAIENQLSAGRRRDLHARIAAALELAATLDADDRVRRLAFHWSEAGELGDPAKGVRAGCDAATVAMRHLALPDAAQMLDRVEELAILVPDEVVRAEIAVLRAEVACLGAAPDAPARQARASATAAAVRDPGLMARAALAHSRNYFSFYGRADAHRIATLRAALGATAPDDRATRAMLLSRLANELTFEDPDHQRFELVDEALRLARGLGDPAILASVLNHRQYVLGGPQFLAIRLREGLEMASIATQTNDLLAEMHSCRLLSAAATERADVALVDQCLRRLSELNDLVDLPASKWELASVHASRAILAGELKQASALVKSAFTLGAAAGQSDAFVFAGAQLMHLNYLRGRLAASMDAFLGATPAEVTTPLVSWVARQLHLAGRADEALDWWERTQSIGLDAQVNVGVNAGLVLNSWAFMASVSGARATLIEELQGRLAPYGDRLFNQLAPDQPGHHFLALLADAMGDHERADDHFRSSLALLERIGAPVMSAISRAAWARSLDARGARTRARELAGHALDEATLAGATQIEHDANQILQGAT